MYKLKKTHQIFCKKSLFICVAGTNPDAPNAESFDANTTIKTFIDGLTDLSKDGYNFLGWSTSANKEDIIDTTTIAEDKLMASLDTDDDKKVTLYAIFELIEQETITITVVCGDVDGDEDVDADDATYILVSTVGGKKDYSEYPIGTTITTIDGFTVVSGDVDGDSDVDADDATYVLVSTVGGKKDYGKFPIGGKINFEVPKNQN